MPENSGAARSRYAQGLLEGGDKIANSCLLIRAATAGTADNINAVATLAELSAAS
ncbi:MAG: hypothetical protein ABI114_06105 [Rhodanobacter sp.]